MMSKVLCFRSDFAAEYIHEFCMQNKEFIEYYGSEGCEMCERDFAEYSYDRFCAYCLDKYNIKVVLNNQDSLEVPMVLSISYKDDSFDLVKVDGMSFYQVQEYVIDFLRVWWNDVDSVRLCRSNGEIVHTFYD